MTIHQLLLFLENNIAIVLAISITLVVITFFLPRKACIPLLIAYVIFILYLTLLSRGTAKRLVNMDIMVTIKKMFGSDDLARTEVLCNILMFMPLGAMVGKVKPRWFWMITVLSILIEAIQYIGKLGMCDIGDVVTNTIGGLAGLGIWKLGKVAGYRVI